MVHTIDVNIQRKGRMLEDHLSTTLSLASSIPAFSLIEFNITELCNRTCRFCPRYNPKIYPNVNEFMDVNLYEKIIKNLKELGYSGTILFSAFGEPLLHKKLDQLIILSKKHCPKARVEIVTNGDFVTADKLRWLFGAGLDILLISMYDGPRQNDHFLRLKQEVGLRDDQLILRVRYLPPEEHFGLTLSNRAGMVTINEIGVGVLTEPLKEKCFYPFYQLLVDYDGTVLLCPHDWSKRFKAGNLREHSILEVWISKVLTFARKRLAQADRNFDPCRLCDVKGTLMGEEHAALWEAFYQSEAIRSSVAATEVSK